MLVQSPSQTSHLASAVHHRPPAGDKEEVLPEPQAALPSPAARKELPELYSPTRKAADREKVLLKPTVLTPEERLKQVISLEDIKQLLMIARPAARGLEGLGQQLDVAG